MDMALLEQSIQRFQAMPFDPIYFMGFKVAINDEAIEATNV